MRNYTRILMAAASEAWALDPVKLSVVSQFFIRKCLSGRNENFSFDDDMVSLKLSPDQDKKIADQKGNIAIIPVFGVISNRINMLEDISGGTSIEKLQKQFQLVLNNDNIKTIIFDFDSPGGTCSGVPEMAEMIFAARGKKPIIAHVNSLAASAAYWLACACDEIVVTPSGRVGSVGVYSLHEDISKMLENEGVKETFIFAGDYKVEGNPFEPLGDEARAAIQKTVDDCYDMFTAGIAKYRNTDQKSVIENYGKGRVFAAQEAIKIKMADRVDTLEGTLARFGVSMYANSSGNRAASMELMKRQVALSKIETD